MTACTYQQATGASDVIRGRRPVAAQLSASGCEVVIMVFAVGLAARGRGPLGSAADRGREWRSAVRSRAKRPQARGGESGRAATRVQPGRYCSPAAASPVGRSRPAGRRLQKCSQAATGGHRTRREGVGGLLTPTLGQIGAYSANKRNTRRQLSGRGGQDDLYPGGSPGNHRTATVSGLSHQERASWPGIRSWPGPAGTSGGGRLLLRI